MSNIRKNLSFAFVAIVAAGLLACGDDGSSSGLDGNGDVLESGSGAEIVSSSSEELESCSSEDEIPSSDSEELGSSESEEPESSDGGSEPECSSSGPSERSSSSGEPESSVSVNQSSSDGSIYDALANTLTDLRDRQTYRTTTISIPAKDYFEVWMAENLNYETENSWCYGDDLTNCDTYGRLYTWAVAVGKTEEECGYEHDCNQPSGIIRGVCPQGWHMPSRGEWEALIVAVDESITEYTISNMAGSKLRSVRGWKKVGNGTDTYSFSVLPAGGRYHDGDYDLEGYGAHFWSSSEKNGFQANRMLLYYGSDDKSYVDANVKYNGYSVRCLKD